MTVPATRPQGEPVYVPAMVTSIPASHPVLDEVGQLDPVPHAELPVGVAGVSLARVWCNEQPFRDFLLAEAEKQELDHVARAQGESHRWRYRVCSQDDLLDPDLGRVPETVAPDAGAFWGGRLKRRCFLGATPADGRASNAGAALPHHPKVFASRRPSHNNAHDRRSGIYCGGQYAGRNPEMPLPTYRMSGAGMAERRAR